MHLGVLAAASHAVTTNTLFTVYYKPRLESALLSFSYRFSPVIFLTVVVFGLPTCYQDKSIHYQCQQVLESFARRLHAGDKI